MTNTVLWLMKAKTPPASAGTARVLPAPGQFSDCPKIEAILDRAATKGYGVKTLIQVLIESELFRNK